MERSFFLSICSIVCIVAIAGWSVYTPSGSSVAKPVTLGGNAFQTAVAAGAAVDSTPLPPMDTSLQANGGTLPSGTSLTIGSGALSYASESGKPATLEAIAIELAGSASARGALFTVAHSTSADWASESAKIPLAATQADDGTWYTVLDAQQLTKIRAISGAGWYVFTGTASRGAEREQSHIALFIQ